MLKTPASTLAQVYRTSLLNLLSKRGWGQGSLRVLPRGGSPHANME